MQQTLPMEEAEGGGAHLGGSESREKKRKAREENASGPGGAEKKPMSSN